MLLDDLRHLILRKFNTGHTSVIPTDTAAFEVVRGSTIVLRYITLPRSVAQPRHPYRCLEELFPK
jgi:hypothetical protein